MIHVFDTEERVFHQEWELYGTVVRVNDPERDFEVNPADGITYGVKFDGHFAEYEIWPGEIRPLSPIELRAHWRVSA